MVKESKLAPLKDLLMALVIVITNLFVNHDNWSNGYQNLERSKIINIFYIAEIDCVSNLLQFENQLSIEH